MKKIVLYSNRHRVDDNRVVELEASAFANAGYETVVYGRTEGVNVSYPGIQLRTCMEKMKDCFDQCLQENADYYIFHDPGLLNCAVKLRRKGKTVLFDAHENYEEKLKTRIVDRFPFAKPFRKMLVEMWWIYEKRCIKSLSGNICADRTVQMKYGGNTYLLPNMPSQRFYEDLPERTVGAETFRLIYVGTLTWDRGVVETIEAIKLCNHKNIEFHVIGDTQDEKLRDLLHNAENTIWHGRVQWTHLKYHLVNADVGTVLLQPTEAYIYCPGENIVKLWEYMSIGLPVLLSDFKTLTDLNNELKFGKNVKPDDPSKIAEAIDWLIDHPQERKIMGENGRACVLNHYNAENYTKGLLGYIEHDV